jgi:hypothetical protein
MFRDLALKSFQKISCDPAIVPSFIAGHDIDSDHVEELVIFGELGEIIVYKVRPFPSLMLQSYPSSPPAE